MKLKSNFFYTLREDVKDEDSRSGNLLVRSGMIKKSSAGVYVYLPFGFKVIKNIENIIRDEMNKTGASELLMPVLIPEEVYEKSGRKTSFGSSIFTSKDRYDRNYILGPTHEELFTIASSMKIKSYKDMPFNLYQFETKFRDEARPRYGLIRVREFIMKDAYSFDRDLNGLDESYNKMFNAYKNIFDRLNLDYKIVTADTGVMGGLLSEEFQAVTDIGEDILVLCESCDYASNIEVSKCITEIKENNEELKELVEIHTPNAGKIKDLVNEYNLNTSNMAKCIIYKVDNEFILVMTRSDDEINEVKIQKLFNATEVVLADEEDIKKITNANVGFAGPIGLDIKIVADNRLKNMKNFLVGANKSDYHFINANIDRDFKIDIYADVRNIKENDICPKCGGNIYFKKGIEVGNTFKLGTKYSDALNLKYLDHDNKLNSVVMGSYGIGLGRCMAAIVEQSNDEKGIIWPESVAPFKVCVVVANTKNDIQNKLAEQIYNDIVGNNIEVLLDDRDERLGVKLNDMDLIGIPIRILVGKKAGDNMVEFKRRNSEVIEEISVDKLLEKING